MASDLLEAVLNSWDRNNAILINLIGLLPADSLSKRIHPESMSIGEMLVHMLGTRLYFLKECVPEFALEKPNLDWLRESAAERVPPLLHSSAAAVRSAVEAHIARNERMKVLYDHPMLMLQHLIWHEGYHHGQIKLVLKAEGIPLDDEVAGANTWDLWMEKGLWGVAGW